MAEDQEHKAARTAAISRALKPSATQATIVRGPGRLMVPSELGHTPYVEPPKKWEGDISEDDRQAIGQAAERIAPFDPWTEGDTGEEGDTGDFEDTGDFGDTGDTEEPEPRLRTGEWLRQRAKESGIIDPAYPIVDTNTEVYAPHIEGSDEMDPGALREAAKDAAVEDYFSNYANTAPVSSSSIEIDGKPGEERVYKSGAVFLVAPADDPFVVLRQKNKGE